MRIRANVTESVADRFFCYCNKHKLSCGQGFRRVLELALERELLGPRNPAALPKSANL